MLSVRSSFAQLRIKIASLNLFGKKRTNALLNAPEPDASKQLITEVRIIVRNARMHACRIPECRIQTVYQGRSTKARRRPQSRNRLNSIIHSAGATMNSANTSVRTIALITICVIVNHC